MTAYLLVDIAEVRDDRTYAIYRGQVSPTLDAVGARYLARGGNPRSLAGAWRPSRLVLVAFSDRKTARGWWSSAAYEALRGVRQQATRTNMIVAEGARAPLPAYLGGTPSFIIVTCRSPLAPDVIAALHDEAAGSARGRGGAFLVLGGAVDVLEGDWRPEVLAVLSFPSDAEALEWWDASGRSVLTATITPSTDPDVVLLQGLKEQ